MDKSENDITIYKHDRQGRMSGVSTGNVIIEKTHSNNSLMDKNDYFCCVIT